MWFQPPGASAPCLAAGRDHEGRELVTVILHTKRALMWVMPVDLSTCCDLLNTPLLFGYRAQDVAANPALQPALAECHLQIVFINSAPGAPLPDVFGFNLSTLPAEDLIALDVQALGRGPLRPAFGVPDGTPGQGRITQIGVLRRGRDDAGHGKRSVDGFAVETIDLRILKE